MREASRRLSQSLFDSYESTWAGEEDLGGIVEVSVIIRDNIKPTAATTLHILLLHEHRSSKDSVIARGPEPPSFSLSLYIINAIFMLPSF